MKFESISIKNFRNIENIEIKFINYEIDKTKKLKRIVRKVGE